VIFACSALLFDLDGVLVDSTPAVARTWRAWAIQHGLDPEVAIGKAHGRRSIETIRELAPHLNAEQENRKVERIEIEDREGVVALPGAAHLLRILPPDRCAIVTSATRELAMARLGYAGLPAPANLISADDVRDGKPSPEPYLAGAKLLRTAAKDCLVFEDAPAGIASARTAGMQVVALQTTYSAQQLQSADTIIKSLGEVNIEMEPDKIVCRTPQPTRLLPHR
jgi:mannitol-1-/sugar-/sorbitol-6-phosphatase